MENYFIKVEVSGAKDNTPFRKEIGAVVKANVAESNIPEEILLIAMADQIWEKIDPSKTAHFQIDNIIDVRRL